LADHHGNVIHLGERECSIQRRHQKLLEEAPSPLIGDNQDLRNQMGAVAVQAAQAVDYINAGTIEFLVDQDQKFYFLEMNTRLQVEHPVTEAVTGIDIVKEQIRIAANQPLRVNQAQIALTGWAMECRINAEDPFMDFMPSTGIISQSLLPAGPGVRVDSGVYSGYEISPYYDALISKLIVHESSRGETIARMKRALEEYRVIGVRTNIPFHQYLLDNPDFQAGNFNTQFVENDLPPLTISHQDKTLMEVAALAATLTAYESHQRSAMEIQHSKRDISNWKWFGRWERNEN
jgi:acetyl/propionyl-CoA carboxylase alpha subunit